VLDTESLLDGLIRGAMSGRRKSWRRTGSALRGRGLVNPQTLLAAAGVAWGLFETWQQGQAQKAAGPVGASVPGPGAPAGGLAEPPPLPGAAEPTGEADGFPPELLQLLRLMISAARADGEIGPAERERILAEAREVGAEAVVARELEVVRPVAEVVRGASDPQLREQLYSLAFAIVRADESLTGGERIYLAQLAHQLALDGATVARLEKDAASRIDAQPAAGA
jgi:uncharacterized membrane protein YebE (DUF533 family)